MVEIAAAATAALFGSTAAAGTAAAGATAATAATAAAGATAAGFIPGIGAAAAGATAAGTAAAGTGFLSTLLQGTATVFSAMSALSAGRAEAEGYDLAAMDAQREIPLETLQGLNRRNDIRQKMMEGVGEQDVAYAASGVDLSFGTPGQARRDAFREADLAVETDIGNEQTRVARLAEREANYRRRSRRARQSGVMDAIGVGLKGISSIAGRY